MKADGEALVMSPVSRQLFLRDPERWNQGEVSLKASLTQIQVLVVVVTGDFLFI